jgi:hypothetical protein
MRQDLGGGEELIIEGDNSKITIKIIKEGMGLEGLSWLSMVVNNDLGRIWEVKNVLGVQKGLGPLLYDVAMEVIYKLGDKGLMADRGMISGSAKNIWKNYYNNRMDDVGREELSKEAHRMLEDQDEKYLNYYYWKDSTPILDRFILEGKIYSEDFNF